VCDGEKYWLERVTPLYLRSLKHGYDI
jgi:hypothetical protein